MEKSFKIVHKSDSLIHLLTEQCADLEKLLQLSREETTAAELGNFGTILNITSERAEIGKRLETFQQQIAELREFLGKSEGNSDKFKDTSQRLAELSNQILVQDQKNRLLLTAICEKSNEELKKLETGNRGTNTYLSTQKKGLAYDGNF